ncbi:MFS transporter [Methanogenium organophilum]|uniref:MFS transporter n=1 Tax=Methanogenium organophilum TaxID=2199 RepID=A0A9X9S4V4_METOG|nr:MFS transporter [Methanogenium organophilum]WAI01566.1 MFS transporter [Methanogenium organophilum]
MIKKLNLDESWTGFIGATFSLVVIYAASSAPIPLLNTYLQTLHLTSGDLSMTAVAYFIGCVISLLMFARVSDYLGRRPVALATLGLAAISCLIFIYVQSGSMLLAGRFVQGIASGLASSAITAYIADNAPASPKWISAAVISGSPVIGISIGAFGSGIIEEYAFGSLSLIYEIFIILLAFSAVLIAAGPETVKRTRGAITSIVPQISIPGNIHYLLPAAISIFVGTWAIGGFYQAFSSTMAADLLNSDSTVVAAAVLACLLTPQAIGSWMSGRLRSGAAQSLGILAFFLCMVAILYSLKSSLMIPFLIATVLAGLSQGAAFTGSMRSLLDKTTRQDRAGLLSSIYLISYSGAAIPNLIVARLASGFSLLEIAAGYVLLVALVCIIALFALNRNKRHDEKSGVQAGTQSQM